ncbi:12767_t:CDS:2 [Entrophospora sp. SA101]|nr:12767_t:CDS:2 [Entrophospora sp. SA101]
MQTKTNSVATIVPSVPYKVTYNYLKDNSSKKPYYKKDEDKKESENFTIEDILASQMDNEEIELDNEEFEQRLTTVWFNIKSPEADTFDNSKDGLNNIRTTRLMSKP